MDRQPSVPSTHREFWLESIRRGLAPRLLAQLVTSAVAVTVSRYRRGPLHPLYRWRHEAILEFLRQGAAAGRRVPLTVARNQLPVARIPSHLAHELRVDASQPLGRRPCEQITPRDWTPQDPTVLYLHGGGYVAGSPATHRELAARIAACAHARVFVLDYRLAPEHPFPAALEDSMAAYHALLHERGSTPSRTLLAGDSAGGGLALALMVALRDRGETLPAGAALLSPWVDLTCTGESLTRNAPYCYLSPPHMLAHARRYLGAVDPQDPLASPLFADLRSLPPMLVQAGSNEVVLSDSTSLAELAQGQGVEVTLSIKDGMFHAWQILAAVLPEAREAIAEVGDFIRARGA